MTKRRAILAGKFLLLAVIIAFFIYPVVIVFVNSVKPLGEIISSPLAFPKKTAIENYLRAWEAVDMLKLMRNTVFLAIAGIAGIIILSSMVAWWCSRYSSLYSRLFEKALIFSMLIPFAALMIPLVQVSRLFRLNNSLYGVTLVYWGLGLAFSYFIIQGAVKGIPRELEESAQIDGCGPLKIFWLIVFPLLKNVVISVIAMDVFWIWNDFITQMILLTSPRNETLQIGINRMFGMYSSKWDIALPALSMAMLPILIVFVLLQKRIMDGVEAGAIKG
jgi:raffinose/stachyose/melibiose transport system permease protein